MNLARGLILSAVLLAAAVLWYLYQPAPPERMPGSAPARESSPAPQPAEPVRPSEVASPPAPPPQSLGASGRATAPTPPSAVPRPAIRVLPVPRQPQPPTIPEAEAIRADLDGVRSMVRDYRSLFRENPVGNNAEIMQAIMGGNKKGAQLGPPEGQKLNAAGELVDRWGTPYFFHQLSKSDMEIRSAGPDRVMWTADDQVTK
ncbi:MAG TPA: hypothetical protein VGO11_14725 [Chthoniobacteraceae bacterium]|jgi:hypothetical protein|nr:hypothetical protein [Chthoniobacteraceae bacterium]